MAQIATPLIFGAATFYFARKQLAFSREKIKSERDADIIKWSNECILLLSALESLSYEVSCTDAQRWTSMKNGHLSKLSALIDQGRMYFPNTKTDMYGTSKPDAFRGFRQPILDHLVEAFHCGLKLEFQNSNRFDIKKSITNERRAFVSIVQREIDVKRRLGFLKKEAKINFDHV